MKNAILLLAAALLGFNSIGSEAFALGHPSPASVQTKSLKVPFPGVFLAPADGKAHPGVLFLHGSEGGKDLFLELQAQAFAQRGYAVLALCWFKCEGAADAPEKILDIDLAKTYEAFAWLRNSAEVGGKPVAIYGVSRGAEHALLLSAYIDERFPSLAQPDVVALHAPYASILPPFGGEFLKDHAYQWSGSHDGLSSFTRIAVERVASPLFVSHGLSDGLAKPKESQKLREALSKAGVAFSIVDHVAAPGADCSEDTQGPPAVTVLGARVEFHYFACEKHIFSAASELVRKDAMFAFLKGWLGS